MIPTQSLETYPIFGSNATKVQPDNAKMSAGYQQADVLPAEWMNWKWNKDSRLITELQEGVSSMEKEMNSVLLAAGISPSESTNNQLLTSIMKVIHPVGSLYWTSKAPNDGGDPNTLFGGVWVQIKDKFILAAGDTYSNGATGGAATVTLTVAQLPPHYHTGVTDEENTLHTHNIPNYFEYPTVGSEGSLIATFNSDGTNQLRIKSSSITQGSGANLTNHTHNFQTYPMGNGDSHNNMPPYIVKYCWERTA